VWRSSRLAVFVDGCFWHGHDCGKNLTPRTNTLTWSDKIRNNRRRDIRVTRALRRQGWSVYRFAECELARRPERCLKRIRAMLIRFHGPRFSSERA
jgi:DNA mismatch endonuclease (patch repair protein)